MAYTNIVGMMRAAQAHLKHPVVRAQLLDDEQKRLRITCRRNGGYNVVSGDRQFFYGEIRPDGSFRNNRAPDWAVVLLEVVETDPVEYARAYGVTTGHCCFCGRLLERTESVSVGYGPICAERYGLPWGGE